MVWEGDFKYGKMNGYILITNDGEIEYEGYCKDDLRHGYGKLHENTNIYEGNFVYGKGTG